MYAVRYVEIICGSDTYGYNHKTYWPALLAEEQEFFDAHQPAADKEDGESKEN